MATVYVDTRALAESRLKNLRDDMDWEEGMALGTLVYLWGDSQERKVWSASKAEIFKWLRVKKESKEKLFTALLENEYIKKLDNDKFEIKGNKKHVLKQKALSEARALAGQIGGLASGKSRKPVKQKVTIAEATDNLLQPSFGKTSVISSENPSNEAIASTERTTVQCNAEQSSTKQYSSVQNNTVQEDLTTLLPPPQDSTRASKAVARGAIVELQGDPVVEKYCEEVSQPTQKAWIGTFVSAKFVQEEIKRAHVWLLTNPHRRPKMFARFMSNWLNRAFEQYRKGLPSRRLTNSEVNAQAAKDIYNRIEEGTF